MDPLKEYRKEFNQIQTSGYDQTRKDIRLSNLMTRMEREFNISIMGDNNKNAAFLLYKEVSQARKL
ncbi:hypothetical protein [Thalassobacillus sp. B23F22_16]|uniref:hypothetical protein n=1 Tax=Thalassobacillus sp. B23F22_16 TaxID=3459513 RepID=UPI00373F1B88